MPTLFVIDRVKGDKRIQWEEQNKKDIAKAKRLFNQKLKDGWLAFGFKEGEKDGDMLRQFSEEYDRIIMQPPFAGG